MIHHGISVAAASLFSAVFVVGSVKFADHPHKPSGTAEQSQETSPLVHKHSHHQHSGAATESGRTENERLSEMADHRERRREEWEERKREEREMERAEERERKHMAPLQGVSTQTPSQPQQTKQSPDEAKKRAEEKRRREWRERERRERERREELARREQHREEAWHHHKLHEHEREKAAAETKHGSGQGGSAGANTFHSGTNSTTGQGTGSSQATHHSSSAGSSSSSKTTKSSSSTGH
jgi:hypothetical protein